MGKIYASAERVICDLGAESKDSAEALNLLDRYWRNNIHKGWIMSSHRDVITASEAATVLHLDLPSRQEADAIEFPASIGSSQRARYLFYTELDVSSSGKYDDYIHLLGCRIDTIVTHALRFFLAPSGTTEEELRHSAYSPTDEHILDAVWKTFVGYHPGLPASDAASLAASIGFPSSSSRRTLRHCCHLPCVLP
ncbi:hypothetical protein B0T25DRAFT_585980 [Lasiosphaeria hispida]|uniref:Uncharacterized protein n=1 Tax=Lasiosphaeria hispida TaxID=260671 RepID=A0AAJ0M8K0_9PEZI|nr:hypothetical protein B0T25DRAFT_585980 [Lasiosphaeria hispida]